MLRSDDKIRFYCRARRTLIRCISWKTKVILFAKMFCFFFFLCFILFFFKLLYLFCLSDTNIDISFCGTSSPTPEAVSLWAVQYDSPVALSTGSLLLRSGLGCSFSFTQPAHSGPAPGRAAETRLHQFQMKHQHFLPLHQSTAPARSPRSLTAPLSVCVMRNGTACVRMCERACVRLCVLCVCACV